MSSPGWSLAIHGGAGAELEAAAGGARAAALRAQLSAVLEAGARVLAAGGSSLDVVEDAVRRLEDSPWFNAGRGSAFNERGEHELEASIMDGRTLAAGAVAAVRGVRNPVMLARRVMERSAHVFLQGDGALAFAVAEGIELADAAYFWTEHRRADFERGVARGPAETGGCQGAPRGELGTVGAVALDVRGHLAAATSTGGLIRKSLGRVGDSSIIGAGTYASDASCAVSCTGHGEYFIRTTAARDVAALMEYGGRDAQTAADIVIAQRLAALGGEGGLIVADRSGRLAWACNTRVMNRGFVAAGAPARVAVYADEPA